MGRCDSGTNPSPSMPRAFKFFLRMSTMQRCLKPLPAMGREDLSCMPNEFLGEVPGATPWGRCRGSRVRPP